MSDDETGNGWITVRTVGTEEEAAVLAGFLDSRDVPVVVDSRLFRQEPVTFGQIGRVEIKVPAEHETLALELLEQGWKPLPGDLDEDE